MLSIDQEVSTIINLIKKLLRKKKHKASSVDKQFVVNRDNHHVSKTDINPNALKVLNRLNSGGFQAYLVGGSVRDLLLRKSPKDFDVATNATPNQIRNLFRNARIIGRRFKLVHILYYRDIIEVATFRGHEPIENEHKTNDKGMLIQDNVYGTLEEDAWRRDFTINSLYYNIEDSSIVDFTHGVDDIHNRLIRIIGDPIKRYTEDPVRMLRAVRFSAKLEFEIAPETKAPIYELSHLISHVPSSRLFEEMIKLYQCGAAISVQNQLEMYGLFAYLFPQTSTFFKSNYPAKTLLMYALESTDTRINDGRPVNPAFVYAILLWFPLLAKAELLQQEGVDPLPSIEQAMSHVIYEQNKIITIPKRHTQVMREIWLLQYRFDKRSGHRAEHLLQHPRFRAAYDFLALRALAGDESMELAQWWTTYQDSDEQTKEEMVALCTDNPPKRKRRK